MLFVHLYSFPQTEECPDGQQFVTFGRELAFSSHYKVMQSVKLYTSSTGEYLPSGGTAKDMFYGDLGVAAGANAGNVIDLGAAFSDISAFGKILII